MNTTAPPHRTNRSGAPSDAHAIIRGNASNPALSGRVDFYSRKGGTLMLAELRGLPYDSARCAENIFAMHIHAMGDCTAGGGEPFAGAGGHYNPKNCPHPAHAGDLPPLFSSNGYAWQGFFTDRFTVDEIIGKAVIIHERRDDFKTQPAGDSGRRIGCGVIERG